MYSVRMSRREDLSARELSLDSKIYLVSLGYQHCRRPCFSAAYVEVSAASVIDEDAHTSHEADHVL